MSDGPGVKIGPWTRLSSREVYSNPWIQVREDQILRPNGSSGIYGVVHMQNISVGVVPVDAQGRVVLVGQHRYTMDAYSWELPEGNANPGERSMQEAAARELREETGFAAARWDFLGLIQISNSVTDDIGHLFLARDLIAGHAEPDPTEDLVVKLVDLEEAHRMAMEGELTESLTVAGLARALHFLEQEKRRAHKRPGRP